MNDIISTWKKGFNKWLAVMLSDIALMLLFWPIFIVPKIRQGIMLYVLGISIIIFTAVQIYFVQKIYEWINKK